MKKIAYTLACLFCCISVAAQNVLSIDNFTAAAGKNTSVPIYLSCTDSIVAVQFDLEMPYQAGTDKPQPTILSTRADGHTVSLRKLSNVKYTVIVTSLKNNALRGNTGLFLRFPMLVDEDAQADDTFPVKLSNIVLCDKDGDNLSENTSSEAVFTVLRTPTPDLVVQSLKILNTDMIMPGGALQLSYNVLNQGTGESGAGWRENIYLEDASGERKFVGYKTYSTSLTAGTTIQRVVEVTVPQIMGIDGTMTAFVEIVNLDDTGELIADQGNNSATSDNTAELGTKLFLSKSRAEITEGADINSSNAKSAEYITLTRSGDWSMDEVFELSEANDDNITMLTIPQSITIKAGQSAVRFRVRAIDNNEVNAIYRTYVNITGGFYDDIQLIVDVEDDDNHELTLKTDKANYTEGDELTLTVSVANAPAKDLKVDITNTSAGRFYPYIRSITIPAGETSASATTTITDNNLPQTDCGITFTASATGYDTPKATIWLADNDRPALTMTLSRNVISEDDGYHAFMATITREGSTEDGISVFVTSNSSGELYFDSNKNIIPNGKSSITIPVSVKDNSMQDGQRQWNVTCALYLTDSKTTVSETSPSFCKTAVTVTDNDTDNILKLSSKVGQLGEGSSATLTVERNSTEGNLTVNISSNDENVTVPQTVVIPAGSKSATFVVNAAENTLEGDQHYASITVAATDFQPASFVFVVSDESNPIINFTNPIVSDKVYNGQSIEVGLDFINVGTGVLPKGTKLELLMSTDKYIDLGCMWRAASPMEILKEVETTEDVAAGETVRMTFDLDIPATGYIGQYYLFAWMNKTGEVDDLNKPMSETSPMYIEQAFLIENVKTDKAVYNYGETAIISGVMSNSHSGIEMTDKDVQVYLVSESGLRYPANITLNSLGEFKCDYKLGSEFGGTYKVGVCCIGAEQRNEYASLSVRNLKVEGARLVLKLNEGVAYEGTLNLTNMSDEPLNNISLYFEDIPEEWITAFDTPNSIPAGSTSTISYSITATTVTNALEYLDAILNVSGLTADDIEVTTSHDVKYYSFAQKCNLTSDYQEDGVKTTLMRGTSREYEIEIVNSGLKNSGRITASSPTETKWLSIANAPGQLNSSESASMKLNLVWQDDMITDGTYKSYVRLEPENGNVIVVPVEVTVVGTDVATFTVDVVDVYTLGAENGDGPHVSGATVKLTNALTGEVALTGTTEADGKWTTTTLKEGTYYVDVTADNHYKAGKTIVIGPGENKEIQVFLPYKAVNITYYVEETEVIDEYETTIEMTIVPDIPQAIVTPKLPNEIGCGSGAMAIEIKNNGRLTAYNPYMVFPEIKGYTFNVISEYPDVLYPGESHTITVEYEGPEDVEPRSVGGIRMYYSYKLQGEMYTSCDGYAILAGCKDVPLIMGMGMGGYEDNGTDSGSGGDIKVVPSDDDESGSFEMPKVVLRDYTQGDDNSVTLEFKQRFFLARQAFAGHLTVENAQMQGIKDITITANVKTLDGEDATDLFAISYQGTIEDWTGEENVNGTWTLNGSETGTADVLYVPAKEAALTEATDYLFGGTLTYRDIETGNLVEVELMQTRLTVDPSPDVHLTYFIQREFISDDPLTTDVVEPWEPSQFALLIQNKGAGAVRGLRVETTQPRIIDNKNNLDVKVKGIYSTIDGVEGTSSFEDVNFGRIEPGQNIMARWWYYCNVSAYVADYNVRMTKCSNYGEEFNLITLDGVKELTYAVNGTLESQVTNNAKRRVAVEGLNTSSTIMLLNEIEDENRLPDYVIDTQGNGTDDLEIVSETTSWTKTADNTYLLTVTSTRNGWIYGRIQDPTNCDMVIESVTRNSDGADITSNFWLTDRTMMDDRSVVYENLLHYADNIATTETYTIVYKNKPAAAPAVKSIELRGSKIALPANAVQSAIITFEEAIDESTFSSDDVTLNIGNKVIATEVKKWDNALNAFVVSWNVSDIVDGDYTLTVFTSGVENIEGRKGDISKGISWTQRLLDENTYMRGDVNGDGKVDGTDVTLAIGYTTDNNSIGIIFDNTDTNLDGKIDATDVTQIINISTNGEDTTVTSNTKTINTFIYD